MSSKTPILLFGATGYIGGSVLVRLLAHPNARTFDITTLVRSEEKAKKLESFGVKTVVGSYKDYPLVEKLSEDAHVVIACADADDLGAMQAILKGLKQRQAKLGVLPILLHTSGTAVLSEGQETKGMAVTDLVFDDSDFEQLATIKPTAFHRNVDLLVFDADKQGFCRTYIVVPGTIYGIPKNKLTDAGLQNKTSVRIPLLIKGSLDRGQSGMVGKGLALWPNVHIDDTADLYIVIYDAIVKNGADNVDHGEKGYYFVENGEHSWYELSKAIGSAMVELGFSKSDEPTAFTTEELIKYFSSEDFGNFWGSNSRARATHSRSIGWKPKYTREDLFASIKPEVEALAASA